MVPLEADADCTASVGAGRFEEQLALAEEAFGRRDREALNAATDAAAGLLPCLDTPVTTPLAARIHRVTGLRGFVELDPQRTAGPFAAARALEPDYVFPASVVPSGHAILSDYVAIDLASGTTAEAPRPKEGDVRFDGLATLQRPSSWPTVFQRMGANGSVVTTRYLLPSDALPEYPSEAPIARTGSRSLQKALTWGALGSAATAGGTYSFALVTARDFRNNAHDRPELDRLYDLNHDLVAVSAGLGTVALASGAGAWLVSRHQ